MAVNDTLVTFVPASNQPPAANYATFGVRNAHHVLAFDQTTQETAIFAGVMPHHYAGGSIKVTLSWMAVPIAGTVGWGVSFERDNRNNHDLDADAWGTEQIVTATAVPGTSGKVETTSVTILAGAAGTDSVDADEPFRIRVRRNVAGDDAAGDAQLLAIELQEV